MAGAGKGFSPSNTILLTETLVSGSSSLTSRITISSEPSDLVMLSESIIIFQPFFKFNPIFKIKRRTIEVSIQNQSNTKMNNQRRSSQGFVPETSVWKTSESASQNHQSPPFIYWPIHGKKTLYVWKGKGKLKVHLESSNPTKGL